jgi:hypothetical protein
MKPVVAFDVDGTLFDENGEPRWDIVAMLRTLIPYVRVVVWSGSGQSYAEHMGRVLFLPEEVQYRQKILDAQALYEQTGSVYPSFSGQAHTGIDIAFDDQDVTLGAVNIKV